MPFPPNGFWLLYSERNLTAGSGYATQTCKGTTRYHVPSLIYSRVCTGPRTKIGGVYCIRSPPTYTQWHVYCTCGADDARSLPSDLTELPRAGDLPRAALVPRQASRGGASWPTALTALGHATYFAVLRLETDHTVAARRAGAGAARGHQL